MRADNELRYGPQTPPGSDARGLSGRVRVIDASANQQAVRPPVDPTKDRIVAAVEEILHKPRKCGEVLPRREDITVGGEHIAGLCGRRLDADAH